MHGIGRSGWSAGTGPRRHVTEHRDGLTVVSAHAQDRSAWDPVSILTRRFSKLLAISGYVASAGALVTFDSPVSWSAAGLGRQDTCRSVLAGWQDDDGVGARGQGLLRTVIEHGKRGLGERERRSVQLKVTKAAGATWECASDTAFVGPFNNSVFSNEGILWKAGGVGAVQFTGMDLENPGTLRTTTRAAARYPAGCPLTVLRRPPRLVDVRLTGKLTSCASSGSRSLCATPEEHAHLEVSQHGPSLSSSTAGSPMPLRSQHARIARA